MSLSSEYVPALGPQTWRKHMWQCDHLSVSAALGVLCGFRKASEPRLCVAGPQAQYQQDLYSDCGRWHEREQ